MIKCLKINDMMILLIQMLLGTKQHLSIVPQSYEMLCFESSFIRNNSFY